MRLIEIIANLESCRFSTVLLSAPALLKLGYYAPENIGPGGSMLKANKTVALEDTLGTGLATLLAINLRLIDIDLPEKPYRLDSDSAALPKLRETLGKGRISVTPKRDGTVRVTVPGGIIILTP